MRVDLKMLLGFAYLYLNICVVFWYLYFCVFVFVSGRANAKLGRVSRDAGWFRNITHRQLVKEEPTRSPIKYPNGKGWNYKFKKEQEIQLLEIQSTFHHAVFLKYGQLYSYMATECTYIKYPNGKGWNHKFKERVIK